MTFGAFPAQLVNAIQQNFLERAFIEPLYNVLAYRVIADKEVFSGRIGDTITKTRMGLMIPNITPLNTSTNTGLDNGLTSPQQYSDEQYILGINQYPQVAPPINLIDDETTIASFAMANAERLGIAQATCLDRLARAALFNAYMSGNSAITVGASSVTQNVDDVRGFQTVVVNGNVVAVSVSNPLAVYVNGVANTVTGFSVDVINLSTAALTGGMSGTVTLSSSVSSSAGWAIVGQFAPLVIRPNGRLTTGALISSDLLNMQTIFSAVNVLRNNAVPKIDGAFNIYLNSTSMTELYQDSEFQLLQRGTSTRDPNYENAWVMGEFLDMRFIMTTETYVQPAATDASYSTAVTVQRPLVVGKGALVEGIFTKGLDAIRNMTASLGVGRMEAFPSVVNVLGEQFLYEGFYYYLRPPLDQLAQIITQTSNYIGGFTVPTDVTTTSAIIPTASNAYYKRAVIIETA
jgi:hypothetical protein